MTDQARGLASQVEHRPQARPRQIPPERKEHSSKPGTVPHYRADAEDRGRSRGPLEEEVPQPLLPLARQHRQDEDSDSSDEDAKPASSSWIVKPDKVRSEKPVATPGESSGLSRRAQDAARIFSPKTDFNRAF